MNKDYIERMHNYAESVIIQCICFINKNGYQNKISIALMHILIITILLRGKHIVYRISGG